MTELLNAAGGLAPLVALGAIALANVIIWFAGGKWSPQKRAYVGIVAVVAVVGVWYWADATAFPATRPGLVSVIVASLVLVLAAAGAPVMKETFIHSREDAKPPATDASEGEPANVADGDQAAIGMDTKIDTKTVRTWGVWSRPR